MKAVFALAATILSISSLSYAGSDHLRCSSPEGFVLSGSLWTSDATISKVETFKGGKLSVKTVTTLSPDGSAQLFLEDSQAEVVKAIADAQAKLTNPENQKSFQPDILIVAPLSKPHYLLKNEEHLCRDVGNEEYQQKAELITVSLTWNDKKQTSETKVTKKPMSLSCVYSYATAPGGGPECAH